MRYTVLKVAFQEVPSEISLLIHVSGCQLRCQGCHSADLWNAQLGTQLSREHYLELLTRFRGSITCVVFLGGEWEPGFLAELLKLTKENGLKTCLYTGLELDRVPDGLLPVLDFIKVGPWVARVGGLECPTTNQKFLKLPEFENLNYLFLPKEGKQYDSIK